mgnify:CR=1 FL=1
MNISDAYFSEVLLCGAYNTILNVQSVQKTTNRKRKMRKIPRKHNGELLKRNDFTKKFINNNRNKINDFTKKFRNAKKNKINDFTRKFRNTKKNNNKIVILKINDFTRKVRNTNNKKIVLNSENHLITIKMLSI